MPNNCLQLQALAFAQHQHAGLQLGQTGQRVFQTLAQFVLGQQRFGTVLMPGMRRQQPVASGRRRKNARHPPCRGARAGRRAAPRGGCA